MNARQAQEILRTWKPSVVAAIRAGDTAEVVRLNQLKAKAKRKKVRICAWVGCGLATHGDLCQPHWVELRRWKSKNPEFKPFTLVKPLSKKDMIMRGAIVKQLLETHGNRFKAAKKLGISRQTLYNMIHRFEIKKEEYLFLDSLKKQVAEWRTDSRQKRLFQKIFSA